jgi:hypothetical protein
MDNGSLKDQIKKPCIIKYLWLLFLFFSFLLLKPNDIVCFLRKDLDFMPPFDIRFVWIAEKKAVSCRPQAPD